MQESAFVSTSSIIERLIYRVQKIGYDYGLTGSHDASDPYSYRLLLQYLAINAGGLAILAGIWMEGWLSSIFTMDGTGMVKLIIAVFVVGLIWCTVRITEVSRDINHARLRDATAGSEPARYIQLIRQAGPEQRQAIELALKYRVAGRLTAIRHIASMLVLLGLVGTVVGFVIALSGVDPEAASDVGAVAPMVSTLIDGLGVALHTTLVGSVLNLWLMLNYRILEAGSARLFTDLLEKGASDESV